MARTPRITAEMLLEAGAAITLEKGADALNVRSVAAKLNCSVQPVFRNFGSMETFRRAVTEYLDGTYQPFVAQYLDKSDYLFTISLAHILLARDRRNLFGVLFLSNEYGSRTVPQIISSPWNREAIDCTAVQYGLTVKEAEAVYRDGFTYCGGKRTAAAAARRHSQILRSITRYSHLKNLEKKHGHQCTKQGKIFGRLKKLAPRARKRPA